ncbi:hypothetical protein niasHT_021821 [Heterodera trifolii]|uniref:Uncharacterized protein n=1 Tax=Heterodera trifolii TaxID=157864 RepID=A0ABD2J8R5_9BILA
MMKEEVMGEDRFVMGRIGGVAKQQQQLQAVAMLLKNGHTKKGPALNDPRGHPPVGQFIHSPSVRLFRRKTDNKTL